MSVAALACAVLTISGGALADDSGAPPATPPATPAPSNAQPAATTPAAAPPTVTLPVPGMAGPLALNPNPYSINLGPLGKQYVTGVVSGLGFVQDHTAPGDEQSRLDLSNGQIILTKIDGVVQYYVQVGGYSLPALGTPYVTAGRAIPDLYGAVPQTFVKLAPTANFSIEIGKLPTLIGPEYTFTFENMNIERGLLWNQENAVNRGVQVNYTLGPVALSVSLNDGFYSDRLNWLSGSAAWTIDSADTLTVAAGGNLGHTAYSSLATPLPQNNGSIYDVIYTHSSGPWTITPYFQATYVPVNSALGFARSAATFGGAVLANYAFTPKFSLAGRVEYIASTGSLADGAPSLIYGPGSKAASITITPTYRYNRLFARGEFSYVKAFSTTAGFAFGPTLTSTSQVRGLLEAGVLF